MLDAACLAISRFVEHLTADAADGIEVLPGSYGRQLLLEYEGGLLSPKYLPWNDSIVARPRQEGRVEFRILRDAAVTPA